MDNQTPGSPQTDRDGRVEAELLRLLFSNGVVGLLGMSIAAVVLFIVMWPVVPHFLSTTWLLAFLILCFLLWLWTQQFARIEEIDKVLLPWRRHFFTGSLFLGILWGTSGILLFLYGTPDYYRFSMIILCGLAAASINIHSPYPTAYFALVIPTLLPSIMAAFGKGNLFDAALGVLILLFMVIMVILVYQINGVLRREITQRFANEELLSSLHASEERYRDLFENASDFVYTLDLAGNFTSVNAAAEKALGYPRETLRSMNITQVVTPESLELVQQMMRKKIEEGVATTYEVDVMNRTGELHSLEVSSRPILREGKPVGIHGMARDITQRKELEKRSREVATLKEDLTKMLVHDFKDPMTVLSGFLGLLEKKEMADKEVLNWLDQMKLATFSLQEMVSNLLDISRLESATFYLSLEKFSLAQSMYEVLTELNFLAKSRGVTLHYAIEAVEGDIEMTGDFIVLKRILTNLVTNAIRHSAQGRAVTVKGNIIEKSEISEIPEVIVEVKDEGEGIAPENLSKIFNKFWTTTTAGKGTGLGLAFCKMAVESQGGKIWVVSELGKGSTFTLMIPKELAVSREGVRR